MRNFTLLAALIFSAIVSTGYSQSPTPEPTVKPVAVPETKPIPEVQTSVSAGPPIQYPIHPSPLSHLAELSTQQPSDYVRPDAKTRFKRYVNSMFGPISLGRNLFNSGIATWQNSPEEWGGQWEGFGRRVASNFGRNVIRQTTIYGLDSALNVDSHFYRSKNKSVKARIYNALVSPVSARKPNGKRIVSIPRLTGAYASSIVAYETWYPSRYDYKDGLKSGTISLGFNAAYNLFKEFVWKK